MTARRRPSARPGGPSPALAVLGKVINARPGDDGGPGAARAARHAIGFSANAPIVGESGALPGPSAGLAVGGTSR